MPWYLKNGKKLETMKNSAKEIEFEVNWSVEEIKWYRRMVIRLSGSACASSSVWRYPVRPCGATTALNFRPAPRATRTPPASVHQRSEWCRFVWFLLTVMRYHPVQVSSGCRSAYRHHRSHTYPRCACAAYRAIWRAFELPSAIFPPAGISDTTQRDSSCSILVSLSLAFTHWLACAAF